MNIIHTILEFQWVNGLSTTAVKACFVLFFVAVGIFAVIQKRDYIYQDAPDQSRWRDLRIWTVGVLLIQIAIYLRF